MSTYLDEILKGEDPNKKKQENLIGTDGTFLSSVLNNDKNKGATDIQLGQYGVGESKYDIGVTPNNVDNLEHIRGEQQSGLAQLGLGVGRAVAKAGVEFAKSPAYLYVLGEWGVKNAQGEDFTLDKALDNVVLNTLENLDESVKETLPVYQSYKAGKGNILDAMTSTSFWASDGADGVGYLLGMMGPGYALKSINLASKLSKLGLGAKTAANAELGTQTLANTFIESLAEAKGVADQLKAKGASPEDIANSARETFQANMGILLIPNLIMNKALLGRASNTSELLDDFKDASGKLMSTPAKKSMLKEYGKSLGIGIGSEGFVEEGGQTAVENYEISKGLHKTDKGFLEGVAAEYIDMLGTTEGQKAVLLGAVLGGLGNVAGKYKEDKNKSAIQPVLSDLITKNFEGFSVDNDVYKRNEDGSITLDDNYKPIVDNVKAVEAIKNLVEETIAGKSSELASLDNDKTLHDYIKHNQFTRYALPFIEQGEVGLDILNDHLDNAKNTMHLMNENSIAQSKELDFKDNTYIAELKNKAKHLQEVYNTTRDVLTELDALNKVNVKEEDQKYLEEYRDRLTNAIFQENSKQIFFKEKIRDLNLEQAKFDSVIFNELPQNRIQTAIIQNEIQGIDRLLQESIKKYEAITDSNEQQKGLDYFIKKSKEAESIVEENEEVVNDIEQDDNGLLNDSKLLNEMVTGAYQSGNVESFDSVWNELKDNHLLTKEEKDKLLEFRKTLPNNSTSTPSELFGEEEGTPVETMEFTNETNEATEDNSEDQELVSQFNIDHTTANQNEESQSDLLKDQGDIYESTVAGKYIASKNNIVMMHLFDHNIKKLGKVKQFFFKRNDSGFPLYDNTSGIDIYELNHIKNGDKVTMKIVDMSPELMEKYSKLEDFDGFSIGIYSNNKLIGFVQQPHPIDPDTSNYDESKDIRDKLINYRKVVISKLKSGKTVTETIKNKSNGNLYTKLNDKGLIDPITNVMVDARDKDKLNGNLVFAYAGKNSLEIKQGDLSNSQYNMIKNHLSAYKTGFKLKPGQPFQVVKDIKNTWSVIPIYSNKIDDYTANKIVDALANFNNSSDPMDISRVLDDYIYTSTSNEKAPMFIHNKGGKVTLFTNATSFTLENINSDTKTKNNLIKNLVGKSRQNINVTNINTSKAQEELKNRNALVTNVTTYGNLGKEKSEYFVQPYLEYTQNTLGETETVVTDKQKLNIDVNQKNTDVANESLQNKMDKLMKLKNIDGKDSLNDDNALSRTKDVTKLDIKQFEKWLSKNLPQLSVADKNLLKDLKTNMVDVYGMYKDMNIYLFEGAGNKTAYHEAFHGVFRNLLSLSEKQDILEEIIDKYDRPTIEQLKSLQEGLSRDYSHKQLTYLYYEEKLADEFAEYTNNENNKSFLQKLGAKIRDFFNKIVSLFNIFSLNNQSNIDKLFKSINKGELKNSTVRKKNNELEIFNKPFEVFNDEYAYSKALREVFKPATEQRIVENVGNKFIAIYQNRLSNNESTNPYIIYSQIHKVFEDFIDVVLENPDGYSKVDINNAIGVLQNWDKVKTETNRYLESRGVKVSESSKVENDSSQLDQFELGDEELTVMESYIDKGFGDATSVSGLTSASVRLKLFLSSLPVLDKDNKVKKDVFGLEEYYNFNSVYYFIERNLTGVYTLNDQLIEMSELSEKRPELNSVISKLGYEVINDPNDESSKIVREVAVNYSKDQLELLRNDFKTNFSKQQLAYTLVKFKTNKKDKTIGYEIIDSNRKTIQREIENEWLSNLYDIHRDTIAIKNKEGEMNPFGTEKGIKLVDDWNNLKTNEILPLNEFKTILTKIGIEYSPEVIESLRQSNNEFRNTLSSYLNWYLNEKPETGEADGKKALRNLVKIETKAVLNNYTSSFNDVENKNIYSIQLPSFVSKKLAVIQTDKIGDFNNFINEMKQDPFYKYSNLLKEFEDSNFRKDEFKLSFLDGLKKSKGESKGSKFTNMNPKDYLAMQLALFQNTNLNKSKNKGSTLSKHIYITPSDKTMAMIFDMKRYQVDVSYDKNNNPSIRNSEIVGKYYNVFLSEAMRMKHALDIKNSILSQDGKYSLSDLLEHTHVRSKNNDGKSNKAWSDLQQYINKDNLTQEDLNNIKPLFNGLAYNFNYFTESFNNKLLDFTIDHLEGTTIENLESTLDPFKNIILGEIINDLTNELTATLNEMVSKGVISKTGNEYKNLLLTVNDTNLDIVQLAASFATNTLLSNIELSNLFNGDVSLYKPNDLQKRTYQSQSMITNNNWDKKTITTKVVKDYETSTDKTTYDSILETLKEQGFSEKEIEDIAGKYGKEDGTNVTDAQVYITPDFFKRIHISRGTWNDVLSEAFDIIEGNKEGNIKESLRMVLGGIKPYYFGNRFDEKLGIQRYEQVKCAMIPLFKGYTDMNPLLAERRQEMIDNGIDMLAHESSFKAAIGYRTDITSSEGLILELDVDNFGIQVDNPIHGMDEKNDSMRQLKMLLIGSIDRNKSYKGVSGMDIINNIMSMEAANIKESLIDLSKKMDTTSNKDFAVFVKDMVTKRGATNNIEELLTIENGEFVYPLDNGNLSSQIENLISSIYTNNVIKQSFAGDARVQASSLGLKFKNLAEQQEGLSEEQLLLQQQLKWIKPTEDGIEYAECAMPAWSKHFFDEKGLLKDIDSIPESLKQIITYRIPTEALHSMLPIKVVKFLPETMGNFILLPYEVTTQMGADFDFDKLYFINKEFFRDTTDGTDVNLREYTYIDGEDQESIDKRYFQYLKYTSDNKLDQLDKEDFSELSVEFQNVRPARNNKIIENYMTLLTAKENLHLLIKPSGFDKLKQIKRDYFPDYQKDNFFSGVVQRNYKERNHIGIALKGQSALHVSGHSYATLMNLTTETYFKNKKLDETKSINFNGTNKYNFSGLYTEDKTLIADELSSIMAAILDDIKEPLLSPLGINKNTIDVLATIIRSGYNMQTALKFISQPAIKELSSKLDLNGAKLKEENQGWYTVDTVISEYEDRLKAAILLMEPVDIDNPTFQNLIEGSKKVSTDISDEQMSENLTKYSKAKNIKKASPKDKAEFYIFQIRTLRNFKNIAEIAEELTQVNKFFAINKEVGPNIEDIISKQELLTEIQNSDLLKGFDMELIPTLKETWKAHQNALKWFSKYFPYSTKTYMDVKRLTYIIQSGKSLNQVPVEDRQYINNFIRYFIDNNFGYFSNSNDNYEKLFVSLPKLISDIKSGKPETKMGNITYDQIKENLFFKSITRDFEDVNPEVQYIRLKGNKLDLQVKNNIIESFLALYTNKNTKDLAIDLVNHSFVNSGFFSGLGSYSTYIHPEILKELGYMKNRLDINKELLNDNTILFTKDVQDRLIDQMIRNNPRPFTKVFDQEMFGLKETDVLPDVINTTLEQIEDAKRNNDIILDDSIYAKYIRLFSTDGEVIYKWIPSESEVISYEKIVSLGKKGSFIEVNTLEDLNESFLKENNKFETKQNEVTDDILEDSNDLNKPVLEQNTVSSEEFMKMLEEGEPSLTDEQIENLKKEEDSNELPNLDCEK